MWPIVERGFSSVGSQLQGTHVPWSPHRDFSSTLQAVYPYRPGGRGSRRGEGVEWEQKMTGRLCVVMGSGIEVKMCRYGQKCAEHGVGLY